jgi:hypothetical protein
MVEGFRREDPPAIPQLAVPITVPNECFRDAMTSADPKEQAIGCLIIIAYYFLLRVGEYTNPRFVTRNGLKVRASRTIQFSYMNIGFFKDGKVVHRRSPLAVLLTCDSATMKITNQKNGRMGDTIHHKCNGSAICPIKALAYRIHHINEHNSDPTVDKLLCSVFHNHQWETITSSDIVQGVRKAAKHLKLQDQGIDPDLIGAHSLRAGGAMALRLHGYDDTTIMKMGRWTSLTFTQYIHNQIAHLAEDISQKMSMPLPFLNIASIESTPRPD